MEDEQAVMVNLYRVTNSLLAGRISEKTAALLLWSAAMVAPGLKSRVKRKTFETQRNGGSGGKKHLPRIHADERGSERNISRESRHPRQAGAGAGTKSTRKNNTNESGSHAGTPPHHAKSARVGHSGTRPQSANIGPSGDPGVTNGKSFVSGVTLGSTPAYRRDRRHRATSEKEKHKGRGASGHRDIGTAGQRKPRIHRKGRQGRNGSIM